MNRIPALVMLIIAVCSPARADDWPHWRGPTRDDLTVESSGWKDGAWPLSELWKRDVGEGSTSPLVVAGRVYAMGWRDGHDHLVCLDAATGQAIWSAHYPCPRYGRLAIGDEGLYSGTTSTPEFDEATRLLYTLSADGDLNCWDTQSTGDNLWSVNLYDKFEVPQRPQVGRSGRRDYGYTSSPLVYRDWVIVEVGSRQGNLVAFNKRTGRTVWNSRSVSPAGHNGGPVPLTVDGVACVAVHNHDGLLVVRLDAGHEGETVATYPWETDFANNIATATVHGNNVLLTSSYNHHRIARLRVTLNGAEKVWEQKQASKVCSPVVYEGHIYWAWRNLSCLDWETGRVVWQGGRYGDPGSCLVTSDGRLIVWANRGDLTLVQTARYSPDRYTELASQKNIGQSDAWPHVVLADGRLFGKDRTGRLVCLRLRE